MKRSWRCLVCGYVSSAENPPPTCPACGAESTQFARVGQGKIRFLRDIFDSLLPHPVAAHIPNGALPAAVLFLLMGLAFGSEALEATALHLLLLTVVVVPVSFVTGVYDWKHRYKGLKVPVFYRKMALAGLLFTLGAGAASLRLSQPDLVSRGGVPLVAYVALLLAMLGIAVLLGHYGGKLVFHWKKP